MMLFNIPTVLYRAKEWVKSPDASANDLMGVALEVNLKVGEGARIIRNFDKQKQKLWLWLTLQKSVCVCGWVGRGVECYV